MATEQPTDTVRQFCTCLAHLFSDLAAHRLVNLSDHIHTLESVHGRELTQILDKPESEISFALPVACKASIILVILQAVAAVELFAVHPQADPARILQQAGSIARRELAYNCCSWVDLPTETDAGNRIDAVRVSARQTQIL
jgi:hypothetical protein